VILEPYRIQPTAAPSVITTLHIFYYGEYTFGFTDLKDIRPTLLKLLYPVGSYSNAVARKHLAPLHAATTNMALNRHSRITSSLSVRAKYIGWKLLTFTDLRLFGIASSLIFPLALIDEQS
jgi:hypothetical protein